MRGNRTVVLTTALVVAISLLVWGCGEKKVNKNEAFKIGVVLSLSQAAAPIGQSQERGIKLFLEQINKEGGIDGHKLEVIILDDESNPERAKANTERLIKEEKVAAVIGSSTNDDTLSMANVAKENNVPLVCMATGTKITQPVNKWVFRATPSDAMVIERVLQYLVEDLKAENIAILHDGDPYGTSGADELSEKAPDYGMEVVAREVYGSADTDMTAQLTRIQGTDVGALLVWGTNPGPVHIAKNMKKINMAIPFVGSHGICNEEFIELGGKDVEGIVHPGGKSLVPDSIPEGSEHREAVDKFARDYKERWNKDIDTFSAQGWDAMALIANAMEEAGPDPDKIREELEETTEFVGINGIYNYSSTDHDGTQVSDVVMIRIKDGKWEWLK